MGTRDRRTWLLSIATLSATACSAPRVAPPADGGADAGIDSGADGGADSGVDGGEDPDADVVVDAGPVIVTTVAGNGDAGYADGTGGPNGTAEFHNPGGVAIDPAGNVFVADTDNGRVRKIDSTGNVMTFAGNGIPSSMSGTGGPDGTAQFEAPDDVAIDIQGYLYVSDRYSIWKIDSLGNVTCFAGKEYSGDADGTGGPDGTARFVFPLGLAADAEGNIYVADAWAYRVRKIDPFGNVTTLAGNGTQGYVDGTGGRNGTAEFGAPRSVAIDSHGNVYVSDVGNNRIRKIDPSGNVTTFAGNGALGYIDGTGGPDGTAEFEYIQGIAIDADNIVYVADMGNNSIREIDPSGNVTTLAGNGVAGFQDGLANVAEFDGPVGLRTDPLGNVYVTDGYNSRIRKISR